MHIVENYISHVQFPNSGLFPCNLRNIMIVRWSYAVYRHRQHVTLYVKRCSYWPKRRQLIFPSSWRYSSLCRTLAQGTQSVAHSPSHAVIWWSLPTSYIYPTLICYSLNEKRQSFNPPECVSCQTLEMALWRIPPHFSHLRVVKLLSRKRIHNSPQA